MRVALRRVRTICTLVAALSLCRIGLALSDARKIEFTALSYDMSGVDMLRLISDTIVGARLIASHDTIVRASSGRRPA